MKRWKEFFDRRIKIYEKPLLILGAALGLTAILISLDFNLIEAKIYDFRVANGIQPKPDPTIVLVTLDNATTKGLDEFTPLPLDLHTQFLEEMEKLEPRALGYLVDFNQINQVNPDLFQSEWGVRFVQAATRLKARGSAVLIGTDYDVTGEVVPPYPLSALPHALARVHKDGNVFGEDKVTRRALLELNGKPTFHVELARQLGLIPSDAMPRGTFYLPEIDGTLFFFAYHGNTVAKLNKLNELPYARVSFLDVIQGKLPASFFRGKIVLVGTLTKEDSGDFAYTPYSKAPFVNPKLVIQANILDSVIHNQGVVRAPGWLNWMSTFAVTTFVLTWVLNSTPLGGLFSTVGLAIGFFIFTQILFQLKGFWLRGSEPLIGIFLGYYLTVPYRLIREYEKRWDYQRKNEILTQVEELKTNFLSLVTHDLKTPVARIQGLAELLLRKNPDKTDGADTENLRHIIGSTEELNHFISSILELSKVESNHLRLNVVSKDVNQLIEKSVEGFHAHARGKNIGISMNLEPLFPIKIDPSLISKVINNLIDNALKYSSPDSEIRIESREVGSKIEISVTDQGIGMSSEEQELLFTRFYRAKNDTTVKIAGTGLGLYLTRYFIEAHQGHVEVISEREKGSTFKIVLPIDGEPAVWPELGKLGLKTSSKPRSWLRKESRAESRS